MQGRLKKDTVYPGAALGLGIAGLSLYQGFKE
jgi:hypothetical protein